MTLITRRQEDYEISAEAIVDARSSGDSLEEPLLSGQTGQTEDKKAEAVKASVKAKKAAAAAVTRHKTVSELIKMALPDSLINCIALGAGCIAALGSALVPYYTGLVIDYASIDPDRCVHERPSFSFCKFIQLLPAALLPLQPSIQYCPPPSPKMLSRSRFFATCLRLVVVAALCGLFTGIRGGLFTLTMTRLNVRIRKRLFHSLLQVKS